MSDEEVGSFRILVNGSIELVEQDIERSIGKGPTPIGADKVRERRYLIEELGKIRRAIATGEVTVRKLEPPSLPQALAELKSETVDKLRAIVSNPMTAAIPFHYFGPHSPPEYTLFEQSVTVGEALNSLANLVSQYRLTLSDPTRTAALRSVVPDQKLAPLKFAVEAGKITIAQQAAVPDAQDAENVSHARAELLVSGERLATELRNSNCDPRFIETIREAQMCVATQSNIIQLGLLNIRVQEIGAAIGSEVSAVVGGMISAYTRGIAAYIGQFPEWQRFCENASIAELNADDAARVAEAAGSVAADLEVRPDVADSEVPRTFRMFQLLLANPTLVAKRTIYAVFRSLENLISKIWQHLSDYVGQTATKTVDRASTATSRLITWALMTTVLGWAATLTPVGARIVDGGWLHQASAIVQHIIDKDLEK